MLAMCVFKVYEKQPYMNKKKFIKDNCFIIVFDVTVL